MFRRLKIDVFGIARDPLTGLNSLPLKKYFSLVKYLESGNVLGSADLNFIDTSVTNMNNYPAVKAAIAQGRPTPIVVINGRIRYFGDIPYEAIYQEVTGGARWWW